jgi:hypothetical protein
VLAIYAHPRGVDAPLTAFTESGGITRSMRVWYTSSFGHWFVADRPEASFGRR